MFGQPIDTSSLLNLAAGSNRLWAQKAAKCSSIRHWCTPVGIVWKPESNPQFITMSLWKFWGTPQKSNRFKLHFLLNMVINWEFTENIPKRHSPNALPLGKWKKSPWTNLMGKSGGKPSSVVIKTMVSGRHPDDARTERRTRPGRWKKMGFSNSGRWGPWGPSNWLWWKLSTHNWNCSPK